MQIRTKQNDGLTNSTRIAKSFKVSNIFPLFSTRVALFFPLRIHTDFRLQVPPQQFASKIEKYVPQIFNENAMILRHQNLICPAKFRMLRHFPPFYLKIIGRKIDFHPGQYDGRAQRRR